jgi:hypothetical protein
MDASPIVSEVEPVAAPRTRRKPIVSPASTSGARTISSTLGSAVASSTRSFGEASATRNAITRVRPTTPTVDSEYTSTSAPAARGSSCWKARDGAAIDHRHASSIETTAFAWATMARPPSHHSILDARKRPIHKSRIELN